MITVKQGGAGLTLLEATGWFCLIRTGTLLWISRPLLGSGATGRRRDASFTGEGCVCAVGGGRGGGRGEECGAGGRGGGGVIGGGGKGW